MLNSRTSFPSISPHSTVCHDFPLICIQLPQSPSHDDQTPVSKINLEKHVSNVIIDVVNTLGTKPPEKLELKNDYFGKNDFLLAH